LRAIPGVPVFRVSRGGQVTYHGPGQLVGYPILKLEGAERDVHRYLRQLEAAMIGALAKFAIAAGPRTGLTGVWVGERKIGSIGVGIRRWITLHGFALNVCPQLEFFHAMVPCGIAGCEMTSVERERGARVCGVSEMAAVMRETFGAEFNYRRTANGDADALWALVDRPGVACEAQPQR
jgi:lipoyl(octanoyl) transferase